MLNIRLKLLKDFTNIETIILSKFFQIYYVRQKSNRIKKSVNKIDIKQKTLSDKMEVHIGSIKRSLKNLKDKGYIKIRKRKSRNFYELTNKSLRIFADKKSEFIPIKNIQVKDFKDHLFINYIQVKARQYFDRKRKENYPIPYGVIGKEKFYMDKFNISKIKLNEMVDKYRYVVKDEDSGLIMHNMYYIEVYKYKKKIRESDKVVNLKGEKTTGFEAPIKVDALKEIKKKGINIYTDFLRENKNSDLEASILSLFLNIYNIQHPNNFVYINQKDLANFFGKNRYYISTVLKRLNEKGYISIYRYGKIKKYEVKRSIIEKNNAREVFFKDVSVFKEKRLKEKFLEKLIERAISDYKSNNEEKYKKINTIKITIKALCDAFDFAIGTLNYYMSLLNFTWKDKYWYCINIMQFKL